MGTAATLADGVVITSDNPRDESPTEIIEHALAGALEGGMERALDGPELGAVWTEEDRALAIHKLLSAAGPHDIILIAGKGHEPYQELSGGVRVHLSDAEVAREALRSRLHLNALSQTVYRADLDVNEMKFGVELDTLSLHTSALCCDAGGTLRLGSHRALSGPVIDTRKLSGSSAQAQDFHSPSFEPCPAFFCLEGARDGHEFIPVAIERGAGAIVARRGHPILDQLTPLIEAHGATLIEVSSPERALAHWASAHRRRVFSGALIGLTGSNGKTSTKELIAGALSKVGETLATAGNFNNHLGVPLTLLRLRASHRFAVIEMGMNAPDEIRQLTSWADPDLGVITTIANAHLERLGSIEAVARAKGELISAIKRGPVLMSELISRELRREASAERSTIDTEHYVLIAGRADRDLDTPDVDSRPLNPNERWFEPQVRLDSIRSDLSGSRATILGVSESALELKTQLLGRHQLENARLALIASLYVTAREASTREIPLSERVTRLLKGIAECPPAPLRGELLTYPRRALSRDQGPLNSSVSSSVNSSVSSSERSGQLWLDCYNANPQSTLAAIKTFFDCGLSGALILGSIGELGDASTELHYELGRAIASQMNADELLSDTAVFTIGEHAHHIQRGLLDSGVAAQRLDHYGLEQLDPLMSKLQALDPPAVLIKGSRSVRLERLVPMMGAR